MLAVLHFIPDSDDPAGIIAALAHQLAPGSYVVISHLTADFAPGQVTAGVSAYNRLVPTTLIPRTHSQVSALFAGLPLVPPGVVPLTEWRPTAGPFPHPMDLYAGVAHAHASSTTVVGTTHAATRLQPLPGHDHFPCRSPPYHGFASAKSG
jgi:S-adenosyl methyltransferase